MKKSFVKTPAKKVTDMTRGDPLRVISSFALPMIFSNLFQQMYNVIDSMIIGRTLGIDAFAAVGSTGMITAVLVQVSTGLALGGSIVAAQLYGAGKRERIRCCATSLAVFMAALAAILTVLIELFTAPLLKWINTPSSILPYASVYLRIYVLGCVPTFLYNALVGIYSALGNSKTPLRFLMLSSVTNIVLDLLFIAGLGMGVGGAAAATVLSQTFAMAMVLYDIPGILHGFGTGSAPFFDGRLLAEMLRFAVPAALQQSVVSIGSVVVQATINSFGTTIMAACAAASRIINLASAVAMNYSNAFGNYVGQNIGAGKIRRIYDGLRASMLCCGGISLCLTIVLEVFARPLVRLFVTGGSVEEAVAVGASHIRVTGAFLVLFALYMILKAVFKGSGDMGWFLFVTFLSFLIRLVLTVGFTAKTGIWMIWWSYGIGWVIAFAVSVARFRQGGWKEKSLKM